MTQGTLPTWDFGGNKAAAITGRHAAALGTLRGMEAGIAGPAGRDPRYLTGGSNGSQTGSLPGGVPSGSGSLTGTMRTAGGTGTAARSDGWGAQQQLAAGGLAGWREAAIGPNGH